MRNAACARCNPLLSPSRLGAQIIQQQNNAISKAVASAISQVCSCVHPDCATCDGDCEL